MWPSLISKAKEGGIDVIETYAFWNQHEPKQGQVNSTAFSLFLTLIDHMLMLFVRVFNSMILVEDLI